MKLPGMNYFENKLLYETDAADVAAELGTDAYALVDSRNRAAYDAAHLPGAIHIGDELPAGPLVVYCWGPGCNGATKACARLIAEGRTAKEMLGGFEYWVREGFALEGEEADRYLPDLSGLVCSV